MIEKRRFQNIESLLFTVVLLNALMTTMSFLDPNQVLFAVDCGSNNYYKDETGILFRPDPPDQIGTIMNAELEFRERRTFFKQNYDWTIHQTERQSKEIFGYDVPLRLPGDYILMFYFSDVTNLQLQLIQYTIIFLFCKFSQQNQSRQKGERVFNINIENNLVISNVDIYQTSQKRLPHFETFQFTYQNDKIIKQHGGDVIHKLNPNRKSFKFNLVPIKGAAKIDAFILYKGDFKDVQTDMLRTLQNIGELNRNLTEEELQIYISSQISNYQPFNEPVLLMRKQFFKDDSFNQKPSSNNFQKSFNQQMNEQNQNSNTKEGGQNNNNNNNHNEKDIQESFSKAIDSFVGSFLQNTAFFVLLILNFICLSYCFRPQNNTHYEKQAQKSRFGLKRFRKSSVGDESDESESNQLSNQQSSSHPIHQNSGPTSNTANNNININTHPNNSNLPNNSSTPNINNNNYNNNGSIGNSVKPTKQQSSTSSSAYNQN